MEEIESDQINNMFQIESDQTNNMFSLLMNVSGPPWASN